jgi:Rrf2 family protein
MKITAGMHYGLKTMIELAMLNEERGLMQKELVERQCIPAKFMDSIIHSLKVSGLITNVAGRRSGYRLAKPAASINVYEIYRAFEPDLNIHFCLADDDLCPRTCQCASHLFLCDFNKQMVSAMQKTCLRDLALKQEELNKTN